jgi:hypothetical protein
VSEGKEALIAFFMEHCRASPFIVIWNVKHPKLGGAMYQWESSPTVVCRLWGITAAGVPSAMSESTCNKLTLQLSGNFQKQRKLECVCGSCHQAMCFSEEMVTVS